MKTLPAILATVLLAWHSPLSAQPASDLVRSVVVDSDGDPVGRVENLLFDLAAGTLEYVVFSFSGLSGFGNDSYPVPPAYLQYFPAAGVFLVSIDQRETLRGSPTLAEAIEEGGASPLDRYWSDYRTPYPPIVEPRHWLGGARVRPGLPALLPSLLDRPVLAADGTSLAKLVDLVIDPDSRRIVYLVLESRGRRTPLPPPALSLDASGGTLTLEAGPAPLQEAPSYTEDRQVDFRSPALQARVREFWLEADPGVALRPGLRILPGAELRVSDLIGFDLVDGGGKRLGRITDLVISPGGRTPYLAAESGAYRYFIPPGVFLLDRANRLAVLQAEPGLLEDLPGWPSGRPPDLDDPDWDRRLRDFWESRPEPATRPPRAPASSRLFLATELLSYGLQDPGGERLGAVEDLVLDAESAAITSAVLSVGGYLGLEEKLLAVPLERASIDAARRAFLLAAGREDLEQAPGFTSRSWPDTRRRGWAESFESYWR